ncbi:MAG: spondin domain-containing protein [Sandaracinaceae bacterium]
MQTLRSFLTAAVFAVGLAGCGGDGTTTTFTVRVENIGAARALAGSGVFAVPDGATDPGPIGPGGAYSFSFLAAPGMSLSFATMFVPSNDLFFGPDGEGIALFDEGSPVTGDVTAQVDLWDAGTEIDQEPGTGADQVQRQGDPDTGAADPDPNVRLASDDFGNLPPVADVIRVTLSAEDRGGYFEFTATIENVSTPTTLTTSDDGDLAMQAVPLSPGVYAVHAGADPLFTVGEVDRGEGLEAIAEDGMAMGLGDALAARTGATLVASPGIYAVTEEGTDLFTLGEPDRGQGLEAIAEDGDPAPLAAAVGDTLPAAGVINTPVGSTAPGPIGPGGAYELEVTAQAGQRLHIVTMFVPSNDWLFTFEAAGIPLFDADGEPIRGEQADRMVIADLGTEVDQPVGFGLDQVQNQQGPNTGAEDPNTDVRLVTGQGEASDVLSVMVTPQ